MKQKLSLPQIHLFESGWIFFIPKLLLAICIYILLLEPLFYKHFIHESNFSIFNDPIVGITLGASLFILSGFIGYFLGKNKKTLFTFLESFILFILIYNLLLSGKRYSLFPENHKLKFVYIPFWGIIVSNLIFLFNLYFEFLDFIAKRELRKITQLLYANGKLQEEPEPEITNHLKLNPDLTLEDIAAGQNKSIFEVDILNYAGLAETILTSITSIQPRKAFTIGLNGTWGGGKSSLVDILKYLISNSENPALKKIRVISLLPWLYPDEKSMITSFFSTWNQKIDDPWLKIAFDDYTSLLNDINIGGITIKLQNLFSQTKSHEQVKTKIEDYLRNDTYINLVIIDDLDRLEKSEILEIARLSRVLANFPNTFYLLAYDRNYIDMVLGKDNVSDKKNHKFFDKIVQLEFKVPITTEENLAKYFRDLILGNINFILNCKVGGNITKEEIDGNIERLLKLDKLQHFAPTIRDINRLINGFLLKYKALVNVFSITIFDVLALEMLFYRYKDRYESFYRETPSFCARIEAKGIPDLETFKKTDNEAQVLLKEIFVGKNPATAKELLEFYFSYFGEKPTLTREVINYVLSHSELEQRQKLIEKYFLEGEAFLFMTTCIQILFERGLAGLSEGDANLELLRDNLKSWSAILITRKISLSSDLTERLSNYFAQIFSELVVLSKQPRAASSANLIDITNDYFRKFKVFIEVEKGLNKVEYIFSTQKHPLSSYKFLSEKTELNSSPSYSEIHEIEKRDDHYYPNTFNLNDNDYLISFTPPDLSHWRLGFVFSKDQSFPLRAFRHRNGFPLFHLGKQHGEKYREDQENIRATAYGSDGDQILDNIALEKVKFQSQKHVSILLSLKGNSIYAKIQSETSEEQIFLFTDYKYFRILAWADNDKDFNQGQDFRIDATIEMIQRKIVSNRLDDIFE